LRRRWAVAPDCRNASTSDIAIRSGVKARREI
jgi:hypothetical protein